MKWVFISLLFFSFCHVRGQAVEPLIFPEFDQRLLLLRTNIINEDFVGASQNIASIRGIWESINLEFDDKSLGPIVKCDFIAEQDNHLDKIEHSLNKRDRDGMLTSIDNFYANMLLVREYGDYAYPLDYLWKANLVFRELKNTIEDPMMELKDWFEFQDLIDDFQCAWQEYELLYQDLILIYFPGFNISKQNSLHDEMHLCINELIESTKTGYRSDFVMPCHKIEDVLEESMALYLGGIRTDL